MLLFIYSTVGTDETEEVGRKRKQLSVFTVVKFPNDVCLSATSGRNGTCYTSSECNAKGGASSGSCASSFGVCCVFEKSCGAGSVAENCTYFTSSDRTAGSSCSLNICKCSSDVCQLRLDFETFTLSNPFTATAGAGADAMALPIGNCFTDFFAVSVPGGKAPPLICGENTGYHMYVTASDSCNTLTSSFGTATTTTTSAFTIKVTQIECSSKLRAPEGCLQYFTASTDIFDTFNYNSGNGKHLANQDYCTCIRAERTACTLCYSLVSASLGLGRDDGAAISIVDTYCGYPAGIQAAADTSWSNYDHIVIPNSQCPVTTASTTDVVTVDRWCGTQFTCLTGPVSVGTASAVANYAGTICTSAKPFQLCLKTDGTEGYATDAADSTTEVFGGTGDGGFQMRYWQSSSCLLKGGPDA